MTGPLNDVKVIEIAGIGPGPFCAMLFADLGAEVLRIDPPRRRDTGISIDPTVNVVLRGRRSAVLDLKTPLGREVLLSLASRAEILVEGFRPGVMERLGLGPEDVAKVNSRLVYGRVTGWGQYGPLARVAGHDLNYVALAGALFPMGPKDDVPYPPLNLVGDYGGGGMLLAVGLLAAYIEAQRSGRGQVVDAAMIDGAALLMAALFGMRAAGLWVANRGNNFLDGAAPWYRVYRTADDRFVAVAAVEDKFYQKLIAILGFDEKDLPGRHDKMRWSELEEIFSRTFATKTQAEWCGLLEGTDVCFAPVLEMFEAAAHPHLKERQTIIERDGILQPAPAPRFSRTPTGIRRGPCAAGEHTRDALKDWGISEELIARLNEEEIITT